MFWIIGENTTTINKRKKRKNNLMYNDQDYGGWLIEDLKDHYKELMRQRDHSELYTDRAQLNNIMLTILSEIQSRERNS